MSRWSETNHLSAIFGLHEDDPDIVNLPPDTKKKILRVMARCAEKAFRRGFQQGAFNHEATGLSAAAIADVRYTRSLDEAPWFEVAGFPSNYVTPVLRLTSECPEVLAWGLSARGSK